MNGKIRLWVYRIGSNFWFVPSAMSAGGIVLALLLGEFDRSFPESKELPAWMFRGGRSSALALLGAMITSMVTVTGVVYSITVVVLSLASSQLGPRLINRFMGDRGNQFVLGTFIGTFSFCLVVLGDIGGAEGHVPRSSITAAVAISLFSLGVLIFFIHHLVSSIQSSTIVSHVGKDLERAVDVIFPETLGREPPAPNAEAEPPFEQASIVHASAGGYVQAIDESTILKVACSNDAVLRLDGRPGDFVIPGRPLVHVWPAGRLNPAIADRIRRAYTLGPNRTPAQDLEFTIDQLVDASLRGLSPSINDTLTVLMCVDWLGHGLCRLASRGVPSAHRFDDRGRLRVIVRPVTFAEMADLAFDKIRFSARTNAAVIVRILQRIADIASFAGRPEDRDALARHARYLEQAVGEDLMDAHGREEVRDAFDRTMGALGKPI